MPWTYALLRGTRVLARVRKDGSFDATSSGQDGREGERVEIRYKRGDGRAYFASLANLKREEGAPIFDDAYCETAEPVSPKARKTEKKADTSSASSIASSIAPARAGEWIAYGDGACSGNPGPAGLGIVVVSPDGKIKEGYEYLGVGTNNIAELTAVLRAVEATPASEALLVHTDSQYAIGVLQKGWKAKANQELIGKVKEALAKRARVRLSYVPGHSGVPMNERADELAREAIRTGQTRLITW